MKTLKKFAFILAIVGFVVITPSCKKEKNENSGNTTPTSVDVAVACAVDDWFLALSNIEVEIVDHNGQKTVETLTTSLPDAELTVADTDPTQTPEKKVCNLYKKVFTVTKFPATITCKFNMTSKNVQPSNDLPYFVNNNGVWKVKELYVGVAACNNNNNINEVMRLSKKVGVKYDYFAQFLESQSNNVRTITIDENGNVHNAH